MVKKRIALEFWENQMIQEYGIEERERYSLVAKRVEKILGTGQPVADKVYVWEINNSAVILFDKQGWRCTPKVILIPDSEELKEDLEEKLGITLTK